MADPAPASPPASQRTGMMDHALELLAATWAYLRVRLELAGIEGREAASQYGKAVLLVLIAVFAVVVGYLFVCVAAVSAVATYFGGGPAWLWATFGAAIFHLVAAVSLLVWTAFIVRKPAFVATMGEFKKDQAWLTNKTAKTS